MWNKQWRRMIALGLIAAWSTEAPAQPPSTRTHQQPSCGQSQAALDALAQSVWKQVLGDEVPECGLNGSGTGQKGSGICARPPVSFLPGDVLPGDGTSVTDRSGNTWALAAPKQDGSGHWYGAIVFNGRQVNEGYYAALRLVDGRVYAEQAKGAGWQITSSSSPGDPYNKWKYVPDPGPGNGCGANQPSPRQR